MHVVSGQMGWGCCVLEVITTNVHRVVLVRLEPVAHEVVDCLLDDLSPHPKRAMHEMYVLFQRTELLVLGVLPKHASRLWEEPVLVFGQRVHRLPCLVVGHRVSKSNFVRAYTHRRNRRNARREGWRW